MHRRPILLDFPAYISDRSSAVRWVFGCLNPSFRGTGRQMADALSTNYITRYSVEIGRRDGVDAMGPDAISAKNVGFLGVAGASGVVTDSDVVGGLGSEIFKLVSGENGEGVSMSARSLSKRVACGVGIVGTAFDVERVLQAARTLLLK